jgi:hypothetical protein
MLTGYYVPVPPRVAGRPPTVSDALIDKVRCGGCRRNLPTPVALYLGHTERYFEGQLVVAGCEDLHPATELVGQRVGRARRTRGTRAARLDGAARLPEVLARCLEILSPLIGGHRLVPDW